MKALEIEQCVNEIIATFLSSPEEIFYIKTQLKPKARKYLYTEAANQKLQVFRDGSSEYPKIYLSKRKERFVDPLITAIYARVEQNENRILVENQKEVTTHAQPSEPKASVVSIDKPPNSISITSLVMDNGEVPQNPSVLLDISPDKTISQTPPASSGCKRTRSVFELKGPDDKLLLPETIPKFKVGDVVGVGGLKGTIISYEPK